MRWLLFLLLFSFSLPSLAQFSTLQGGRDHSLNMGLNIGSGKLRRTNPSAFLELGDSLSSKKGLLGPRGWKDSIQNPVFGLIIADVPSKRYWWYSDTGWAQLGAGNGIRVQDTSSANGNQPVIASTWWTNNQLLQQLAASNGNYYADGGYYITNSGDTAGFKLVTVNGQKELVVLTKDTSNAAPVNLVDELQIDAPLVKANGRLGVDTINAGSTSIVNRGRLIQLINAAIAGVAVNSITLLTSGTIHNSNVTFTNVNGAWTGALNLATQAPRRVFASDPSLASSQPTFRALQSVDLPDLDAGKITSGVFPAARLGTGTANSTTILHGDGVYRTVSSGSTYTFNSPLITSGNTIGIDTSKVAGAIATYGTLLQQVGARVVANTPITGGTFPKITYDSKGLVTSGSSLVDTDIPSLDAAKITTGVFPAARLGTGTASSSTVLHGDGVYRSVSGGGATITTPGANRLLTSDGTATGIVGQASLTWDGQSFQVSNNTNVSAFRLQNSGITNGVLMDLEMPATTSIFDGKALSFKTNGESFARGMIYSNGMVGWGPGTATRDVYLHRTGTNILRISANGGSSAANLEVQGDLTARNVMITPQATDPAMVNGELTVNSTENLLKVQLGGVIRSVPTYTASGLPLSVPLQLTHSNGVQSIFGGVGFNYMRAPTGVGWATGFHFQTNNATDIGGFGAWGDNNTPYSFYIGKTYNDATSIHFTQGGKIAFGTHLANADFDMSIGQGAVMRLGSKNAAATNDNIGRLEFYSADSDAAGVKADITTTLSGNVGPGGDPAPALVVRTANASGTLTERMRFASTGATTINNLSGSGSRMVLADANGQLSTQAIPSVMSTEQVLNTASAIITIPAGSSSHFVRLRTGATNLAFPTASGNAGVVITIRNTTGSAITISSNNPLNDSDANITSVAATTTLRLRSNGTSWISYN